jgi:hypothetical protein
MRKTKQQKRKRVVNADGSIKVGPRQQFTGSNGKRYKLESIAKILRPPLPVVGLRIKYMR